MVKKRHLLIIIATLLLLIVIVTSGIVSIAVFTKSTRTKRVLAPYGNDGMLFSSNYLGIASDSAGQINKRFLYASDNEHAITVGITVCNYAQKNHTKMYERDINYTVTAKLVILNGSNLIEITNQNQATYADALENKTITITYHDTTVTLNSNNLSQAFSQQTLSSLAATTHSYEVSFSTNFNDDTSGLSLYMKADPGTGYPNISALDAVFSAKIGSEQTEINWKGYFSDQGAMGITDAAPADYDGYNYTIEGTGKGTVKLSWRPDMITPSAIFLFNMNTPSSETIENVVWNYVEFDVDSGTTNRYDLQLYKSSTADFSSITWYTLKNYVSVTFTEELEGSGS